MAPNPKDQKWYYLAEQLSMEMDQAKLMALINQLCAALDERMKYRSVDSTGAGTCNAD